jgi:acetolactate synthase-1/3 small subunit
VLLVKVARRSPAVPVCKNWGTRVFDFAGMFGARKRRSSGETRQAMRHTISVLVENKFGVLTRIAGLFSGRGYNIDTLNVAPTQDPSTSRMTIVTRGDDATLEQIVKQLNKLVDVLKVTDFREGEYVDRELVLAKVNVDSKSRAEVMQITDIFRAKIVDVQPKTLTIEITGDESKIEKFLELMKTFGIVELTRTGKVALPRN